jgi:hypothetical protein
MSTINLQWKMAAWFSEFEILADFWGQVFSISKRGMDKINKSMSVFIDNIHIFKKLSD